MKTSRRLPLGLLMIASMQLAWCTSAMGFDFEKGIHGMSWASSISEYGYLTKVRETEPIVYYVNEAMLYTLVNQPVPGVIYGFYKGQFYAVFIKLRSPDQFHHIKKRFSAEYGPARVKTTSAGDQTIYRWQERDVKIKLKIRESSDEMKLGIYYNPISNRTNLDTMEKIPPEAFRDQPSEYDPATRSAPLL